MFFVPASLASSFVFFYTLYFSNFFISSQQMVARSWMMFYISPTLQCLRHPVLRLNKTCSDKRPWCSPPKLSLSLMSFLRALVLHLPQLTQTDGHISTDDILLQPQASMAEASRYSHNELILLDMNDTNKKLQTQCACMRASFFRLRTTQSCAYTSLNRTYAAGERG